MRPHPFEERRRRVLEAMGDAALLVPSIPEALRNGDVQHPYRATSDLYYLTGFREPRCAVLLRGGGRDPAYVLFVRPRERDQEIWTGFRAGMEGAKKDFGAQEAYPIGELRERLKELLEGIETFYVAFGLDPEVDRLATELVNHFRGQARTGKTGPTHLVDAAVILHEMRLRKDPSEIERMERAAEISAEAHREAMAAARPGMYEYELQALLEGTFRRLGADGWAYPTIVGSGPNACILHYQSNSRRMEEGELVLVDAGAEFEGYAADITRTFPVGGRFREAHAALYDVVLRAQEAAIQRVKPGVSVQEVHETALGVLVDGLLELGLVHGPREKVLEDKAYRRVFMHRTSHWLGLDVHDVGRYKVRGEWRPLEPGMVLTVEPGLYVAPDDLEAPEEFRGVGIRIEDDVLVTEGGNRILTDGVPKRREEVEALASGGRSGR
jgi:Xaa-Pro aminopeptidase